MEQSLTLLHNRDSAEQRTTFARFMTSFWLKYEIALDIPGMRCVTKQPSEGDLLPTYATFACSTTIYQSFSTTALFPSILQETSSICGTVAALFQAPDKRTQAFPQLAVISRHVCQIVATGQLIKLLARLITNQPLSKCQNSLHVVRVVRFMLISACLRAACH